MTFASTFLTGQILIFLILQLVAHGRVNELKVEFQHTGLLSMFFQELINVGLRAHRLTGILSGIFCLSVTGWR